MPSQRPGAECSAARLQIALLPHNPIVTGRHGDAASPRRLCPGWWMMPRWTSLRGASHNRSFQKAALHTAAWGTAGESNIHQQPAKQQRYQQTQFRAKKHYCFSLSPLFDSVNWLSDAHLMNMMQLSWYHQPGRYSEGLSLDEKTFCKKKKEKKWDLFSSASYWSKSSQKYLLCLPERYYGQEELEVAKMVK